MTLICTKCGKKCTPADVINPIGTKLSYVSNCCGENMVFDEQSKSQHDILCDLQDEFLQTMRNKGDMTFDFKIGANPKNNTILFILNQIAKIKKEMIDGKSIIDGETKTKGETQC